MTIPTLPCGCVRVGNAIAYCKTHSARNPPGAAEPAAVEGYQRDPARPAARSGKRQRWSPETGELEPPAEDTPEDT